MNRPQWVRAQDLPAILEAYTDAKQRRARRRRTLLRLVPWIAAVAAGLVFLAVLLALAVGCHPPCGKQGEHPDTHREDRDQRGARNAERGADNGANHRRGPSAACGSAPPGSSTSTEAGMKGLPANNAQNNRPPTAPRSALRVSRLLDAIRQVESGNRPHPPDGDGGRSIGPYQIQRGYWTDAQVPWAYQAVRGEREGRLTVLGYWRRRAPAALAAGDLETLARLHNGGPAWAAKPATVAYWRRVVAAM